MPMGYCMQDSSFLQIAQMSGTYLPVARYKGVAQGEDCQHCFGRIVLMEYRAVHV